MMDNVSRRALLKAAGLTGAGLVITSVVGTTGARAQASARGFSESPFLAERVAAGALPSIDERLPMEVFRVGQGVLLQDEFLTWEDVWGKMREAWGSEWKLLRDGESLWIHPNTPESTIILRVGYYWVETGEQEF